METSMQAHMETVGRLGNHVCNNLKLHGTTPSTRPDPPVLPKILQYVISTLNTQAIHGILKTPKS